MSSGKMNRRKSMPAFLMEKEKENNDPEYEDMTMPIRMRARASLAPGRGILKASNLDDEGESSNFAAAEAKRRKSLFRRVSFAPEAAVRRFDPERESASPAREPVRRKSALKKTAFVSPPKLEPPKSQSQTTVAPSPKPSPRRKASPKKSASPAKSPSPRKSLVASLGSPSPATRTRSKSPIRNKPLEDEESDMDISVATNAPSPKPAEEGMLISFDSPAKPVRKLYPEIIGSSSNNADDETSRRLSFPSIFKQPYEKQDQGLQEESEDEESMDFTNVQQVTAPNQAGDDDDDDSGEQSMEFTAINGQVLQNDSESDNDDEQTMDVTRALGSILEAPDNGEMNEDSETSMEMTRSLGVVYREKEEENDDEDVSMDVTRAIGRIHPSPGNDSEMSMDVTRAFGTIREEGEDSMEMTQAVGKINISSSSPAVNGLKRTSIDIFEPSKRMRPSTPERQTVNSSELAINRSPARTPSRALKDGIMSLTPRRSARRTPKASPPRQRLTDIEIISHTPLKSAKTWEVPGPEPSPMKSQMIQRLQPIIDEDEGEDEDGDESDAGEEEEVMPNVELSDFLNAIQIDFMDDFLTSTRGHSSFGLTSDELTEPKLEDYVVAGQKIAVFGVYDFSIREMRNNVRTAKEVFQQFEEDTLEENPLLFREFFEASPDTKQIMNGQFKMMKTYSREQARNVWYSWRTTLIQDVYKVLERNQKNLRDDQAIIRRRKPAIEQECDDISSKYHEMKRKLENLRLQREQLENCDRVELITAQNALAETKTLLSDAKAVLEKESQGMRSLRESVEQLLSEKHALQNDVQSAEKVLQDNRQIEIAEILELKTRFSLLEACSLTSRTRFKGSTLLFSIDRFLTVSVDLDSKNVTAKILSDDPRLRFFEQQLTADLEVDELSAGISVIKQRWAMAKRIVHDLKLLQLQHMSNTTVDKNRLVIRLRLQLSDSKLLVKTQVDVRTLLTYPNVQGQVSMSNLSSEAQAHNALDHVCKKFEQQLVTHGIAGLTEECNFLLESSI